MLYPRPQDRSELGVAIICSNTVVYDALRLVSDDEWNPLHENGNDTIQRGCIRGHMAVLVFLSQDSSTDASSTISSLTQILRSCQAVLVLDVGLRGAVSETGDGSISLGDVIISKEHDYEKHCYDIWTRNLLALLQTRTWQNDIREFTAAYFLEFLDRKHGYQHPDHHKHQILAPKVYVTGDTDADDGIVCDKENSIAFDMEGAGVRSIRICVRAACDYSNSHNNSEGKKFAAGAVAAAVKAILQTIPSTDP